LWSEPLAGERGWPACSYGTVRSIVVALDPALLRSRTTVRRGYRDRFELVFPTRGRGS
jgi:hypothetical protein